MERLTIRNDEGIGVLKQPFECERCGDLQMFVCRIREDAHRL